MTKMVQKWHWRRSRRSPSPRSLLTAQTMVYENLPQRMPVRTISRDHAHTAWCRAWATTCLKKYQRILQRPYLNLRRLSQVEPESAKILSASLIDTLVGTLDYGQIRIAQATMGYKHREVDSATVLAALAAPNFL